MWYIYNSGFKLISTAGAQVFRIPSWSRWRSVPIAPVARAETAPRPLARYNAVLKVNVV